MLLSNPDTTKELWHVVGILSYFFPPLCVLPLTLDRCTSHISIVRTRPYKKNFSKKKPVAKQKSTLKIQLPFGLDVISIVLKGLLSALSCCLLTSTLIDREQVVDEIEVQRRKEGKRQVPLYTHTHPLVAAACSCPFIPFESVAWLPLFSRSILLATVLLLQSNPCLDGNGKDILFWSRLASSFLAFSFVIATIPVKGT